ncbi:unknown [Bacteroides sp. CAG:661]|nr:unknown [Bacteroides sp. CAG:661]
MHSFLFKKYPLSQKDAFRTIIFTGNYNKIVPIDLQS